MQDAGIEREIVERELGIPSRQLHAKFLIGAAPDKAQSKERGRPIFVDMVTIAEIVDGAKDFVCRVATDEDKAKYPFQWRAFLDAREKRLIGIECVPGMTPAVRLMLEANGCRTLQDVAAFPSPYPEIADAVLKAQRWLAIDSGVKPRIRLEAAA